MSKQPKEVAYIDKLPLPKNIIAVCYFCEKHVTEEDYCFGCKHFVCEECDKLTPIGNHHVKEHQEEKEE